MLGGRGLLEGSKGKKDLEVLIDGRVTMSQ